MIDRLRRRIAHIAGRLKRALSGLRRVRRRLGHWRDAWREHFREQKADQKERASKRERRDGLRFILAEFNREREKAIEAGEDTTAIDASIADTRGRIVALHEQIEKLTEKIAWRRRRKRHAIHKRRFFKDRVKFWITKKTRRRHNWKLAKRKLERAKAHVDPEFEPWMANGYPYSGLPASLRKWIAIAVVKFDLAVSSTKRNWGTGSYHDIWRAIDVAGSWERMIAFQRYVVAHGCGNVLECFGPDNTLNCDNGVKITQPEGSPNEDLHDTHVHVADE